MAKPELTKPFATKQSERAVQAMYNVGAKKLGELVAIPVGALIARGLPSSDESLRAKLADALQSDVGQALVTYLTGLGLEVRDYGVLPKEVQARLADACQVKGMEGGLEQLVDVFFEPLMEAINAGIRGIEMFVPKAEPAALPVITRETLDTSTVTPVEVVQPLEQAHE